MQNGNTLAKQRTAPLNLVALGWLWGGFGGALGWLWGAYAVPINTLRGGFDVALGWQISKAEGAIKDFV